MGKVKSALPCLIVCFYLKVEKHLNGSWLLWSCICKTWFLSQARDIDTTCLDKLRRLESSVKRSLMFPFSSMSFVKFIYVHFSRDNNSNQKPQSRFHLLHFHSISIADSRQCRHQSFALTTMSALFASARWQGRERPGELNFSSSFLRERCKCDWKFWICEILRWQGCEKPGADNYLQRNFPPLFSE